MLWRNLRDDYTEQRRLSMLAHPLREAEAPLTAEKIAPLPPPVQRYLRVTGSLGKPPIRNLQLSFAARLMKKPGQQGMPGPAEQFERFDPPRRLFFMTTRMYGLPVAVFHDYNGARAAMTVRAASLFNVVDLRSEELARTETVTLLNDLCCFAPSLLSDPRLEWSPLDDGHASVAFTNGPHRVSATLEFDEAGRLVNFFSEDRGALQDDGTLVRYRWSTPLGEYREFEGRQVATRGETVWHYPDGPFAYGRFTLTGIRYDVGD
ncbi:MAG TPA: hypothetical protein PLD86_02945 [Vicinamibacteria bacterium]|nr:hypothetical protein [Vicinamibacteria bacterium]